MARKVIDPLELPSYPPMVATLVWWLVLERLEAPGWIYGALGALLALVWIAWAFDLGTRESVKVIK